MSDSANSCEVAIIGGGLSGLTAANLLQAAGVDFRVLEASSQLGGRIASLRNEQSGEAIGDLGPTWVWPPYQSSVRHWLDRMKLKTFPQYEQGDALLDVEANAPPTRQFLPGQHGMARIAGGPSAFIDAHIAAIEAERVLLGYAVCKISNSNGSFRIDCSNNKSVVAEKVIVAAPLRIIAEHIDWSDLLDDQTISIMRDAPTWMATQAKVTVMYDQPFWREKGLSGRIASRLGPMVEIHDHCGENGLPAALFGFVGWPPDVRQQQDTRSAIIDQLVRCFGDEAAMFNQLEICDWSTRSTICSRRDLETLPEHPRRLHDTMRMGFCGDRLFFAVAETASESPGLIDGALECGGRAARQVIG
ncbi:MAG: FAD-dependent oxidoreductase [Rhizobiaceae bacterium]